MQKIRPDLDLGNAIQKLRRKNKMTQDAVLTKLQLMNIPISKSTYSKIETNRMNIKVSELIALKIIFNASFDDFFNDLIKDCEALGEV